MGQARGRKASWDPVVYVTLGTVALVASAGCGGARSAVVSAPSTVVAEPVRHARVVIITIDGLRPDAVTAATAPNLLTLAARGAATFRAQTVFPANTLPAHASILSGYGPDRHGIKWDEYVAAKGFIPVPTVLSAAGQSDRQAIAVVGKKKLQHLNAPGGQFTFIASAVETDEAVATLAVSVLTQGDFDLLFVHLPQTDITGHSARWMSAPYLAQLGQADAAVGRILAALPDGTTVIVTADHGGTGDNHSAQVAANMTVPWVISGPNVRAGYSLTRPVNVKDTASTTAYLLGLTMPGDLEGRPVFEAFGPVAEDMAPLSRAFVPQAAVQSPGGAARRPTPRGPFRH